MLLHACVIVDLLFPFGRDPSKSIYSYDCWSQPLSSVLELVSAGQRVNICSRSNSDLLQGKKLNTFFVFDWEWSQPLPLDHVLVSVGQRVNIWSRSCSNLLQGNKLHTFFVFDCEWSQPLPLVLVLISEGQRVNIWSCSCSDLIHGNKLNTFVSLVRNQLQGPSLTWDPVLLDGSYQVNDASSWTN
jgi:hypothetical protein